MNGLRLGILLAAAALLGATPAPADGPGQRPSAKSALPARLERLPPPPASPENPSTPGKVELGKILFFDRRLSGDGTMSCVSCHDPETGYGDGLPTSFGYPTTANWRNAPGLLNAAYKTTLFWDGRASSLEEQALFPVMSAFEMNQNLDYLEEELKEVPEYVEAFRKEFGGDITRERIAMALAAFERTLVSADTPLDRFLGGDAEALTPLQKKGYDLFTGKGGCVACHAGPNLSDGKFHDLGIPDDPKAAADPRVSATRRFTAKVAGYADYRALAEDPGRFLVTKDARDWKAFATPPLREVGRTAPYMHNGVFRTLDAVIDFLDRGGGDGVKKKPPLKPLGFAPGEKEALKAFLAEALSGAATPLRPPKVP